MNKAIEIFKLDYYRNTAGETYHWYNYFKMEKKLKLLYWIRKCQNAKGLFKLFARFKYRHFYGYNNNNISWRTKIGKGLYLGHTGGRYINEKAVIGDNCNINHNVTIGQENRGSRKGAPTIGNQVWLGAGCVIVGKINIGNNVLIAPNAFVNFDVPDNSIVIGNPGKIINKNNSTESYINNII